MRLRLLLGIIGFITNQTSAADWDNYPIPATPDAGYEWKLMSLSDDFNYTAPANGKNETFYSRWQEGFINQWQGPGLTQWEPEYSKVADGYLQITTGKNQDNGNIFAGSIVSKVSLTYPIYMEVRAKISDMVTASNFWLLSKDSTQEIDVLEAYGSGRPDQTWFAERIHLSHHVFIRTPFQDYQPTSTDTWYAKDGIKWKDDFHTVGVYWRDPWHLEYYIDGVFIKSSSGKDIIDPLDYTAGTGLSKPMQAIINTESHTWRSDDGIIPTDAELNDSEKNLYLVDWVRFYQAVPIDQSTDTNKWQDGDVITTEFSDFIETGKEGEPIPSDTVSGFGIADSDINFNTVGDWATYTVNFTDTGFYRVELIIASPESIGIGAEIQIDNTIFSTINFTGTGDWSIFQNFAFDKPLEISTSGSYNIKIKSIGSAEWQWNGDKISFVHITPIEQNPTEEEVATTETHPDVESDTGATNENNTDDANNEDGQIAQVDPVIEQQSKNAGSTSVFNWLAFSILLIRIRRT